MAINENESMIVESSSEKTPSKLTSSSELTPLEQRRLRSFIKAYAHKTFIGIIEETHYFKRMGSKEPVCTDEQRKEIHNGLARLEEFLKKDLIKKAESYNETLGKQNNSGNINKKESKED